jgi:histidyl-tRNA synthetase
MKYRSIKGTKDILPGEVEFWQEVEKRFRETTRLFGYREIRTPIFEETALFKRGIGEETDIVGKEMYTFADQGGDSLTLRPEMTASVVRSYIQQSLGEKSPTAKLYYIGPMFRQERPQAGRLRQFHQFGCELLGSRAASCDAEIILVAADFFDRLGIPWALSVNSIGDSTCRPVYREALRAYLENVKDRLSADSQRRMDTNPLRVLDSKAPQDIEATVGAPSILDYLSDDARSHFTEVRALLDAAGVSYAVEPRLVRGLDYYTHTAFEFTAPGLGSQNAICGGGRYDNLIEMLGGKSIPAIGFAAGVERLLMAMEAQGVSVPEQHPEVYIIGLDRESRELAFQAAIKLRRSGMSVDIDFLERSIKAQMREANRLNVSHVIIIGEEERLAGVAIVKNMGTGDQEKIPLENLPAAFKKPDTAK